jgi:hypothetical protein
MLAAGLSDDLLHPPSQRGYRRISHDGELVSAHQERILR